MTLQEAKNIFKEAERDFSEEQNKAVKFIFDKLQTTEQCLLTALRQRKKAKEKIAYLYRLTNAYDRYIQDANDEDKYKEGWYPVCIKEFEDCEFKEFDL